MLQGNLSDLPLVDLVKVLTLQNKTGILSLNREFSQAQITFTKSKVYSAYVHHAYVGRPVQFKEGEEALYDLLCWLDGQFSFEISSTLPTVQNVNHTWEYIILEHFRRQDELERSKQDELRLADVCARMAVNPPKQAEITLGWEDWQVLLKVDGHTTFREISQRIRVNLEQVCHVANRLENLALIEVSKSGFANDTVPNINRAAGQANGGWAAKPLLQQTFASQAPRPTSLPKPAPTQPALPPPHYVMTQVAPASMPTNDKPANWDKPKVNRGIISGIMAKIRGL